MKIKLGDIVRLKKKHPCGGDEWQIVRLGADIGIKCLKCQHHVRLERSVFERRFKALIPKEEHEGKGPEADREQKLEAELADLRKRWPAHSVPLSMWQKLEDLEEELEKIRKEKPSQD